MCLYLARIWKELLKKIILKTSRGNENGRVMMSCLIVWLTDKTVFVLSPSTILLTLRNTLNSRAKDNLHSTSIKRRYIVDISLTISSLYRQLWDYTLNKVYQFWCTHWKHHKTFTFLMFSAGMERDQWHEMDYCTKFTTETFLVTLSKSMMKFFCENSSLLTIFWKKIDLECLARC